MKKQTFGCLLVFLLVALGASIFVNFILLLVRAAPETASRFTVQPFEKVAIEGSDSRNQIAVVRLYGLISYGVPGTASDSMVDDIVRQLKQAREDSAIKGVIVRIDSPGGEVTASDVIFNAIRKTDAVKPVLIYMDSVAASGGYYAAVGGRFLMANETTITGSIGVIIQSFNFTDTIDKIGMRVLSITSGDMKDVLNPFREPEPDEIAFVQGIVDESYSRFLGIVATERELDANQLRRGVADGRILTGSRALEAGLIDATGYFQEGVEKARELAGVTANAELVYLEAPFSLGRIFRLLSQKASAPSSVTLELDAPGLESDLQPGRPYYLSPHLWAASP